MGRHRRAAKGFALLFVCTGNICRSPFAEILTRHLLTGRLDCGASAFAVSSAGIRAVVGAQMHERTRRELAPWRLDGVAAGPFRGRQLSREMIGEADLVVGMNLRHRSAVIQLEPGALPTSFGLLEFARLAAAVDPDVLPADAVARAHDLVEEVRRQRGLTPPTSPEQDQVPDPVSGTQKDHHAATTLIRQAVDAMVEVIAPRAAAQRRA